MKREVKGLSPVIATVLLIVMVIIIALIIFLWVRGFTEEAVTKFDNQNIQIVCENVAFEAEYSGNALSIRNSANVPIFGMDVKVMGDGSHSTTSLREDSNNWPEIGLNSGDVFYENLFFEGDEIILTPVLVGRTGNGELKTYVCDTYGSQIFI